MFLSGFIGFKELKTAIRSDHETENTVRKLRHIRYTETTHQHLGKAGFQTFPMKILQVSGLEFRTSRSHWHINIGNLLKAEKLIKFYCCINITRSNCSHQTGA